MVAPPCAVGTEAIIPNQNRTSTMGTSILSRFIECSRQSPASPAIFIDDRPYTYDELKGLCSAVCTFLKAHDLKKGDRVGILTENNVYTYASILGILSSGACYVPMNHGKLTDRFIFEINTGRALTEKNFQNRSGAGTSTPVSTGNSVRQ